MRASHEDALICDFAEYYGIYSFGLLPLKTEAALAFGLPDGSRVMREISGCGYAKDTLLLAGILDELRILTWQNTESARKKRDYPKSVLSEMVKKKEDKKEEVKGFESAEDFASYRKRLLRGMKNG